MQKNNQKITIWGYGNMGKAIASTISNKDKKIKIFTVSTSKKDTRGVGQSDFIILAVKPQQAEESLAELKALGIHKNCILISIMAGVSIKKIASLSGHKKIVRIMPNLGVTVGAGIAVWKSEGLSKNEINKTKKFIDTFTENFEVQSEEMIDKVTAISASGPAYFFLLAQAMVDTSIKFGFTKAQAQKLVEKTFLSGALLGMGADYPTLISKVKSKGGTTEAALGTFQKEKFNAIVEKAMRSAYKRAKELSKMI